MKILFCILLFTNLCFGQFKKYPYPILDTNSSKIVSIYGGIDYNSRQNIFVMNYRDLTNGLTYRCKLSGGVKAHSINRTYGMIGQLLLRKDSVNWIGISERLVNPYYRYVFTKSTNNGFTWYLTADTVKAGNNSNFGEDVSAMYDSGKKEYRFFARDSTTQLTKVRTVCTFTSKDLKTFTARKPILTNVNFNNPNSKFYRKSLYEFSAVKKDSVYFGIANVFQHRADMLENNSTTLNYSDHTLQVYLYTSKDGENWKLDNNDSLAAIPFTSYAKQVLGVPVIVRDYLYIYTIENPAPHNGAVIQGKWKVYLYTKKIN